MVACIERPAHIPEKQWLERWLRDHRKVAVETQATFSYVRNRVVTAVTEGAPGWAGIVEEGFEAEAVTNPMLWYRAEGSQEKLQANLARMLESVGAFLDLEKVESNPMSEYRF